MVRYRGQIHEVKFISHPPSHLEYVVPQLSPQWFALRRPDNSVTFTASNVAALIGFSKYATAASAYAYILHSATDTEPEDTTGNQYTRAGQKMEQPICDAFLRYLRPEYAEFGDAIKLRQVGIFASLSCPWILASPDRILDCAAPGFTYHNYLVEIKFFCFSMPSAPRPEHLIQCTAQMFVAQSEAMFLVYACGDQMQLFMVRFSKALWGWIFSCLEKLRTDLVARKPWENQVSSHYHVLESYWKSGTLSLAWKRACDCATHRAWRTNNASCAFKRRKTVVIGKERCDHLPPPPHVNLVCSTTDSQLGDDGFEVLLSEGFKSKSSTSSSSKFS